MAKWRVSNGKLVPYPGTEHHGATPPEPKGVTAGEPCAGIVRAPARKDTRRFDKPSDSQVRHLIEEDEAYFAKQTGIGTAVTEASQELREGTMQIDSSVIDETNKRILPFGSVQDGKVTRIVPQSKVPKAAPMADPAPPSTAYVNFTRPEPVNPPTPTPSLRNIITRGFNFIAQSDGEHRRRTI